MKKFFLFLIGLIVIMLLIPLILPKSTNISIEREIPANVDIVFEEFNNLKEMSKWEKISTNDSVINKVVFPPSRGIGAELHWNSKNKEIGSGILKITEAEANRIIGYEMKYNGWNEMSKMKVSFQPLSAKSTKVKWEYFSQEVPYFYRYANLFVNGKIEKMIEDGFDSLFELVKSTKFLDKSVSKNQPGAISIEDFGGLKLIGVPNETSLDQSEIQTAIDESYGLLYSYLYDVQKASQQNLGLPTMYYQSWDTANKKAVIFCGVPITDTYPLGEGMELKAIPSSKVLVAVALGPRSKKIELMQKMKQYAKEKKINLPFEHWEVFLKDPKETDSTEMETKIYYPIQVK